MNLQQLRAICEVVENGMSVSEAARTLHTTQPAVSKQIRAFEVEMRTTVFRRSKGRLAGLTPAGRNIHSAARTALNALAEIRSVCSAEEESDPRRFFVAASRSMALNVLPAIISRFVARYPGAEVTVIQCSLARMLELLAERQVSMALTIESVDKDAPVVALPLDEIPRIVVVPAGHPLLKKRKITLEDVAAHPLVLYDDSFTVRREVMAAFRRRHLQPRVAVNASTAEIIKAYVAHGLGISVLSETSFDAATDTGLAAIPAGHLFTPALRRIVFSQHHYLKKFEYDFIELCAPQWTRREIQRLVESGAARPGD